MFWRVTHTWQQVRDYTIVAVVPVAIGALFLIANAAMFVTNAAGAMRHRIWVAVHTFLICMSIVSTTILFVTPTRDAAVVVLGLHAGRIAARLRLQVWAFYEIWRRQRHNVPPEQRNAAGRLGMSYITNRVIVMPWPVGPELDGIVPARIGDIQAYLDANHANAYVVVNGCRNRSFAKGAFHDRVWTQFGIGVDDVPPLADIMAFCHAMSAWINGSPDNVAAIASVGHGRAGLLVSCWLVFKNRGQTAANALRVFCSKRGIAALDTPSQSRYVSYFADLLQGNRNAATVPVALHSVEIRNAPDLPGNMSAAITSGTGTTRWTQCTDRGDTLCIHDAEPLAIDDDFRVTVLAGDIPVCSAALHTAFLDGRNEQVLLGPDLDYPFSDHLEVRIRYQIRSTSAS
ncbi:hypothetical protein PBRA_003365 [Plasmodiophora brassicae]|nr:hypothetical protein PBRA_003365 [Plasmodiophora brassicae]